LSGYVIGACLRSTRRLKTISGVIIFISNL
jgi:hypothetical protein